MTIKEIAELAGVSISTVSKVINKKDAHITAETRERVLQIVRAYHYTPYGDILAAQNNRKFLVGIMYDLENGNERVIPRLVREAGRQGYSTIVVTNRTAKDEHQNFQVLRSYNVDGLIWNPVKNFDPEQAKIIAESGLPYLMMDFRDRCDVDNVSFDYWEIGYRLTELLLKKQHRKILCLLQIRGLRAELMFQGYRQCLFDHQVPFYDHYVRTLQSVEDEEFLDLSEFTAVLCYHLGLGRRVVSLAQRIGIGIPQGLSVIAVGNGELGEPEGEISLFNKPTREIAEFAMNRIVAQIEGRPYEKVRFPLVMSLNHEKSIAELGANKGHIVVIGSAAMETTLEMAQGRNGSGTANECREEPGGSGLKQALTVTELGGDCILMCRVGSDAPGHRVYNYLKDRNVTVNAVLIDSEIETDRIYTIRGESESSRIYYGKLSYLLTTGELEGRKRFFQNCRCCLLAGETAGPLLCLAAEYAHDQNAETVVWITDRKQLDQLKPDVVDVLVVFADVPPEQLEQLVQDRLAQRVLSISSTVCRWISKGKLHQMDQGIPNMTEQPELCDVFLGALVCDLAEGKRFKEAIPRAFEHLRSKINP